MRHDLYIAVTGNDAEATGRWLCEVGASLRAGTLPLAPDPAWNGRALKGTDGRTFGRMRVDFERVRREAPAPAPAPKPAELASVEVAIAADDQAVDTAAEPAADVGSPMGGIVL